jgi:hypothetical protein
MADCERWLIMAKQPIGADPTTGEMPAVVEQRITDLADLALGGRLTTLESFLNEDTIDSQIEAEVVSATAGHVPGTELGYAESGIGATTTVVYPSLTLVSALTMVVSGEGRPVDIEWFMPLFYHSVANTPVYGVMVTQIVGSGVNVYEQVVQHRSPVTNGSDPFWVKRRKVLLDNTDYTVAFYVCGSAAGTTSYGAAGGLQRMWAGVTSR